MKYSEISVFSLPLCDAAVEVDSQARKRERMGEGEEASKERKPKRRRDMNATSKR
mgnify:CR=1 FL=1|tara:strand:- start:90 stop:254 length:165 start_codon:yes stop_codon:yes gene_type:complete